MHLKKQNAAVDEEKRQLEEEKQQENAEKLTKKVKKAEKSVKAYQYFVLRLIVFLFVLWILFFQIIGLMRMPSGDMYPRLDGGDVLLYYRLDKSYKAQNIVVIEKDTEQGKKQIYVCRVIAVAGDTVDITDDGHVIVNGNSLIESNIFYGTPRYTGYGTYPIKLIEGQYFVLADHRSDGVDSRVFGPVEEEEIIGTVISIMRRNNL